MTNRNKDEVHLWPLVYFSSQLKHNRFSLLIANSVGDSRLKGMVFDDFVGGGSKSDSGGLGSIDSVLRGGGL